MPHFSENPDETSPTEDGINNPSPAVKDMSGVAVDEDDYDDYEDEGPAIADDQWLEMFNDALDGSIDYSNVTVKSAWSRNYRAFDSKHVVGSKYNTPRYRNRSKLFRPKTRMSVRKNMATTAGALFSSTETVVAITPERGSDPVQSVTARVLHEVLNYRLDRVNVKAGPSWFMTSMGARQDTQLTGRCVSKQYWEYEDRVVKKRVTQPRMDVNGLPVLDMMGQPEMEEDIISEIETTRDRPNIVLIPPEQCHIDPTGDWRDPIQESGYFIAAFPMRLEDVEDILDRQASRPRVGGGAWRTDIDVSAILANSSTKTATQQSQVRQSREDGTDRYSSTYADENGTTVWLYECFYKYGGVDWHFWTLGEHILLSDPRPVEESYPEQKGERPYVSGVGEVESHKTHPTAPVQTWQPLQQEMNEMTNLGLDALKMSTSPITKIVKGRGVDLKQVQNRGPDSHIMVTNNDDVTFDRAPPPPALIQSYMNNINLDFDELAGVFSGSSVQSNRQMNETVGGMNLLSQASNALTEFDLRVWVETWVEPCLRQVVRCIQHYESNETILSIAGEKAGLLVMPEGTETSGLEKKDPNAGKVTIKQAMDAMENMPITLRVNVGMGAIDNQQKLGKFMGGVKVAGELMEPLKKAGVRINAVAVVQEVFGLVGYKSAGQFFESIPEGEKEPPPPEVQKAMMEQKGKQAAQQADLQSKMQIEQLRTSTKMQMDRLANQVKEAQLALDERELAHQIEMDNMKMRMDAQMAAFDRLSSSVDQQHRLNQPAPQPRNRGK